MDLIQSVKSVQGAPFAHIEYVAEEKLPKKLGLGHVEKYVSGEVQLNYSYENAINGRLEKAGETPDFKADKLPWGVWETPNKIIAHKGAYYLRFYCLKGALKVDFYMVDGRPATDAEIAVIKAYNASKNTDSVKQAEAGLIGEEQVKPRAVNMDGIMSLKCGTIDFKRNENIAV